MTQRQILLPDHIDYLIVNHSLAITEMSAGVKRFADSDHEVKIGLDVRLGFPELIGSEDSLLALLSQSSNHSPDSFTLKGMARTEQDGSQLYFDLFVRTDFPNIDNLLIFLAEVTDRMMLEQTLVQSSNETQILLTALANSRDYVDKIITSMADALLVTDTSGAIKKVNPAAQNMFGYSEAELINQSISFLITDIEVLHQIGQCAVLTKAELCRDLEVICLTKAGKRLTVYFSCAFAGDAPEQDLIYIGRDISDRKKAEVKLQESESLYRDLFEDAIELMFEHASDLIQWSRADGRLVYVNRAWQETLGYSDPEIATLSWHDIIHPNCQQHFQQIFASVLEGEKLDQIVVELVSKSGEKVWVEGNISCKFTPETGQPASVIAIFRDITARLIAEAELRQQKAQSERLLLNILPESIAAQLKQYNSNLQPNTEAIAENFADVSVLFADIVGFTAIAASLSPIALVNLLNQIFSTFDRLTEKHGLEKIKTIGDAYMVVGGMPTLRDDHAEAIADMALDMQTAIAEFNHVTQMNLKIRIGIHSGSVVAGVIGIKKFIYDLWGDTVNIASRLESHGIPGQTQVSAATYHKLQMLYQLQERGMIQVKDRGEMLTYLLLGKK